MSNQRDFIAGKNPIIEALKGNRPIHKIWVAEGSKRGQMTEVLNLAKDRKINVQTVPKKRLDQMVPNEQHQGVVAQVAAYEYAQISTLFQRAKERNEHPFFLILDGLEDPHNLGSIMRTADGVGAHGIIIPKHRSVGLTATVAKASAGAIEHIPVTRVTNIARTMEQLKKEGLWLVGTDAKGNDDYRDVDYNMPVALVIGSEGRGISRLVKEKCDFLVNIPLVGKVTSLNASVAAGLLMYEVFRSRNLQRSR